MFNLLVLAFQASRLAQQASARVEPIIASDAHPLCKSLVGCVGKDQGSWQVSISNLDDDELDDDELYCNDNGRDISDYCSRYFQCASNAHGEYVLNYADDDEQFGDFEAANGCKDVCDCGAEINSSCESHTTCPYVLCEKFQSPGLGDEQECFDSLPESDGPDCVYWDGDLVPDFDRSILTNRLELDCEENCQCYGGP